MCDVTTGNCHLKRHQGEPWIYFISHHRHGGRNVHAPYPFFGRSMVGVPYVLPAGLSCQYMDAQLLKSRNLRANVYCKGTLWRQDYASGTIRSHIDTSS
jgi:hypothetical protein